LGFSFLLICSQAKAQINHPKTSPFTKVEQVIGLAKITIEYSRPAARGRTVFGNQPNGEPALVLYGQALFQGILADTTSQQELDTIKAILETNGHKFFNLALDEHKLDAVLSINNYHDGYAEVA
tara:strand:- start:23323 stop:23694 length:372 start_codon:yes stop_codon:yes gene_type:complete